MILYFSAEGNSAYAAKKIAAAMHDHAVSMEKCDPVLSLQEDEMLGIVTPTYFWQLPSFVRAFLERLQLAGSHQSPYVFLVASYGTTPGFTGEDARRLLLTGRNVFPSVHPSVMSRYPVRYFIDV